MTDSPTPPATPTSGPPSRDLLADRYGRRPRGARCRYVAAVTGGALALAAAGWAGWAAFGRPDAVHWRAGNVIRVDDGRALLPIDVDVRPGLRVVCTVRLFNAGMTEVGRLDVTAGPAATRTFSVTASVPTFEAATSGAVRACVARG